MPVTSHWDLITFWPLAPPLFTSLKAGSQDCKWRSKATDASAVSSAEPHLVSLFLCNSEKQSPRLLQFRVGREVQCPRRYLHVQSNYISLRKYSASVGACLFSCRQISHSAHIFHHLFSWSCSYQNFLHFCPRTHCLLDIDLYPSLSLL